jgi:hypothetical protein
MSHKGELERTAPNWILQTKQSCKINWMTCVSAWNIITWNFHFGLYAYVNFIINIYRIITDERYLYQNLLSYSTWHLTLCCQLAINTSRLSDMTGITAAAKQILVRVKKIFTSFCNSITCTDSTGWTRFAVAPHFAYWLGPELDKSEIRNQRLYRRLDPHFFLSNGYHGLFSHL